MCQHASESEPRASNTCQHASESAPRSGEARLSQHRPAHLIHGVSTSGSRIVSVSAPTHVSPGHSVARAEQ
eukprot:2329949-Rhodomonas_salina.1